ncbi:MAG: hypothetical protein EOS55_23690 [Mesorhizobium sp.]|nr:MAG: hypothetical protein EOS55_23690 [Mesorhizobium sp.]
MSSLIGIMTLVGIAAGYSTFEQLRPRRGARHEPLRALLDAARGRARPLVTISTGMPFDQAVHCQRARNSRERSRP